MDGSSPDWDFVTASSNHANALQPKPESPTKMFAPGLQTQVCPDQSLVETCKAVKDFLILTAGCYTQEISVQRTALWASRPRSNLQDTQTTQALLSILSPGTSDLNMRHNLTLFARCVEVLGYSAKTFVVVSAATPQIKTLWSIRSTDVHCHQSFLGSTKEYIVDKTEKSRNTAYPLPTINTTVTVFVTDNRLPQQAQRTASDSITYILPGQHPRQTEQLRGGPARAGQESERFAQPQPLPPLRSQAIVLPPLSEIEPAGLTAERQPQASSRIPGIPFQPGAAAAAANYTLDISDFPSPSDFPHTRVATEQTQLPPEQHQPFMFKTPAAPHPRAMVPAPAAVPPFWPPRQQASAALLSAHMASTQLPLPSLGAASALSGFSAPAAANFAAPRRGRGEGSDAPQRKCANCGTSNTRQWVRGEQNCWLCHSCGQFWRKNGYGRPAALWNRPTFKRSRRKTTSAASSSSTSRARQQQQQARQQQLALHHLPSPPVRAPPALDPAQLIPQSAAPSMQNTLRPVNTTASTQPLPQTSKPASTSAMERYGAPGSAGMFPGSGDPSLFRENL